MSARHGTLDLVPLHDDAAQIAVEPVVLGLRDRSGVGKHGQHESAGIVLVVEMLRVAVRIRPEGSRSPNTTGSTAICAASS